MPSLGVRHVQREKRSLGSKPLVLIHSILRRFSRNTTLKNPSSRSDPHLLLLMSPACLRSIFSSYVLPQQHLLRA
jgi:hypothetical protein